MIGRFLWMVVVMSTLAAPTPIYDDYTDIDHKPDKRAALVLDRLFVALQKALREESEAEAARPAATLDRQLEGPQAVPLRVMPLRFSEMNTLQRRGQTGPGRGRILRCYFNAITCF